MPSRHPHRYAVHSADDSICVLQKLAARCERKMCAARLAIAAAEERERAVRAQLPLAVRTHCFVESQAVRHDAVHAR